MRQIFCSFLVASALGFTAQAQDGEAAPEIGIDAPSLSETEQAEPDWFRQFTVQGPPESIENNPALQSGPSEALRFSLIDAGRWQFSIDLTSRPEDSPLPREEMSAGATFQISPRFSVGGDLSVGANELDSNTTWLDEDVEAGIRLRSAFRF